MVVKIYISGISGNKEVKKRQQRVLLILDSKNVKYEVIDIAEPGSEDQKDFMHNKSTSLGATISDPTPRHALPPQIFNDQDYCGDYDQFDMANEIDEMEVFLKLAVDDSAPIVTSSTEVKLNNGDANGGPTVVESTTNEDNEVDSSEVEVMKVENKTDDQKLENGQDAPDTSEQVETEVNDEDEA